MNQPPANSSVTTEEVGGAIGAMIGGGTGVAVRAMLVNTTVQAGGGRVDNIGLQQQQMMAVIVGIVIFVARIALVVVNQSNKSTPNRPKTNTLSSTSPEWDTKSIAANQKYLVWTVIGKLR